MSKKLTREEQLSTDLTNEVALWKLQRRFHGIAYSKQNESGISLHKDHGARLWAKKVKMGCLAGITDWDFMWNIYNGRDCTFYVGRDWGWIELKAPQLYIISEKSGKLIQDTKNSAGTLSTGQEAFRDDCLEKGFNWAVCYSVAEVEATLIAWGALTNE